MRFAFIERRNTRRNEGRRLHEKNRASWTGGEAINPNDGVDIGGVFVSADEGKVIKTDLHIIE